MRDQLGSGHIRPVEDSPASRCEAPTDQRYRSRAVILGRCALKGAAAAYALERGRARCRVLSSGHARMIRRSVRCDRACTAYKLRLLTLQPKSVSLTVPVWPSCYGRRANGWVYHKRMLRHDLRLHRQRSATGKPESEPHTPRYGIASQAFTKSP